MNLRTIASRLGLLAALVAFAPSCSGGGGGSASGGPAADPVEDGAILKITYFRSLPEPKTKKLKPAFRAVMSESWRDRMGDGPREPLAKAAPKEVYMGYLNDITMAKYVKKLREFGLDDLKSRNPDDFKPEDYGRLCVDPQKGNLIRIFTIGNEKGAKSYYYPDQQTDKELIEKFVKCESYIMRACEYAINVQTMSDPLPGRPK